MKFKRFLSLFFVVLLAVCIPCAFLAGCNGNSDDDGTDGNTSNNDSNGDKTGSGDEIFTEGMTLAQLRAATENIDNFTMEFRASFDNYKESGCLKVDGNDLYQLEEYISDGIVWEDYRFSQDGYRYEVSTKSDINGKVIEIRSDKSLLTYGDPYKKIFLWGGIDIELITDGEAGLEINEEDIASEDYQVTSYVRLKGSVLEYGWTAVGKAGTSYEGETEQYDFKFYGVNATVVDTSKIQSELVNAEWADRVSYNGYSYRKAVDKDGNEYYYIESSHNSEAEPEKTINTLPVKPRES